MDGFEALDVYTVVMQDDVNVSTKTSRPQSISGAVSIDTKCVRLNLGTKCMK